jgi:Putative Actinobacterial Holin-X, holin superfamily III
VADQYSGNSTLSERSTAELLKQLSDQTATLVRQELELAKVELTAKGKQAGIGAGMFGAAGMVGLYALGALTAAIVAVAYGAVAGVLALTGKTRVSRGVPPTPEQAAETVKEDVAYVRERAQEGRR